MIETKQQAITELTDVVHGIAITYDEQFYEDITQSCWVRVLESLPLTKPLLIVRAEHAATHAFKATTNNGMTPFRSKYAPPQQHEVEWLHGEHGSVGEWSEPTYTTVRGDGEMMEHLLSLCETDQQRRLVNAYKQLVDNNAYDGDSPVSQAAAAEIMGVGQQAVSRLAKELQQLYIEDMNQ